jgi:hypothetical protein
MDLEELGTLKITFLYSEDCPSHDEALQRLRRSIELERISADIEIVKVTTDGEAERRKFVGSPTIVVNGRDIDPPAKPHYALTCRAYTLEDGRISPLPSEATIRRALREAKAKEQ